MSKALNIDLLTNHGYQSPPVMAAPAQDPTPQGPKLDRPKVDIGISIEEWNVSTCRWDVFLTGLGIGDGLAPFQLF